MNTEFRIPDPDCLGFSWVSNPNLMLRYEIVNGQLKRFNPKSVKGKKVNPDWVTAKYVGLESDHAPKRARERSKKRK